jgi:hypothetical protein
MDVAFLVVSSVMQAAPYIIDKLIVLGLLLQGKPILLECLLLIS